MISGFYDCKLHRSVSLTGVLTLLLLHGRSLGGSHHCNTVLHTGLSDLKKGENKGKILLDFSNILRINTWFA